MNISFTGINNVYMAKRSYSKNGAYLNKQGIIDHGKKNYKDVMIQCELTNDENGNDLDEFFKTIAKSRPHYINCIDSKNSAKINLRMSHFDVFNRNSTESYSNFSINGCEILLDEREALPLHTFMARLTRKIASDKNLSDAYRAEAKSVNNLIAEKTMDFIENM